MVRRTPAPSAEYLQNEKCLKPKGDHNAYNNDKHSANCQNVDDNGRTFDVPRNNKLVLYHATYCELVESPSGTKSFVPIRDNSCKIKVSRNMPCTPHENARYRQDKQFAEFKQKLFSISDTSSNGSSIPSYQAPLPPNHSDMTQYPASPPISVVDSAMQNKDFAENQKNEIVNEHSGKYCNPNTRFLPNKPDSRTQNAFIDEVRFNREKSPSDGNEYCNYYPNSRNPIPTDSQLDFQPPVSAPQDPEKNSITARYSSCSSDSYSSEKAIRDAQQHPENYSIARDNARKKAEKLKAEKLKAVAKEYTDFSQIPLYPPTTIGESGRSRAHNPTSVLCENPITESSRKTASNISNVTQAPTSKSQRDSNFEAYNSSAVAADARKNSGM